MPGNHSVSCQSWQVWAWWLCLVSALLGRVVGMGRPCKIVTDVPVPAGGIAVPVVPLWRMCLSCLLGPVQCECPVGPCLTCSVFSHQVFKFRKVPLRSKLNLPEISYHVSEERCVQIRDCPGKNKDNNMLTKRKNKESNNSFHVSVEGRGFKKVMIPVIQFKKWCKWGGMISCSFWLLREWWGELYCRQKWGNFGDVGRTLSGSIVVGYCGILFIGD